jgi:hypothetical protein
MSTGKSWLRTLLELIEVFFNSSQRLKSGRTWHQHVVPYKKGWRYGERETKELRANTGNRVRQ